MLLLSQARGVCDWAAVENGCLPAMVTGHRQLDTLDDSGIALAPRPHPLSFLLVEDDDDHAKVVRLVMDEYRVANELVRVRDGAECMAYLRGEGEFAGAVRPDVVLLDLRLPRMDGHAVLAAMRADAELRGVPVVVMSTSDDPADQSRAVAAGAVGYLVKPVDFGRFAALVRQMNFYWSVWNRSPG
jgi:CheY-like chemotaxis protein